jgi:hypothetical protein
MNDFQGKNRKKSMNFLKKIEKNLFFSKKQRGGGKKSPRRTMATEASQKEFLCSIRN